MRSRLNHEKKAHSYPLKRFYTIHVNSSFHLAVNRAFRTIVRYKLIFVTRARAGVPAHKTQENKNIPLMSQTFMFFCLWIFVTTEDVRQCDRRPEKVKPNLNFARANEWQVTGSWIDRCTERWCRAPCILTSARWPTGLPLGVSRFHKIFTCPYLTYVGWNNWSLFGPVGPGNTGNCYDSRQRCLRARSFGICSGCVM